MTTKKSIYVASSWRNEQQPAVVEALRAAGHDAYDFKEGADAFSWKQIDPAQPWASAEFVRNLNHPLAQRGFEADRAAMVRADEFCLVLPSGRSAHLEAGWAMGIGKPVSIFFTSPIVDDPELMYLLAIQERWADAGDPDPADPTDARFRRAIKTNPFCFSLDDVIKFHGVDR